MHVHYGKEIHHKNKIKAGVWSNGTAFIYEAEDFKFDSYVGQTDNGSKF